MVVVWVEESYGQDTYQQLRVCYKNLKTRVNCFCFLTACVKSGKTYSLKFHLHEAICALPSTALKTIKSNDDKIRVKVYEAAATLAAVILLYRYLFLAGMVIAIQVKKEEDLPVPNSDI